MTFESPEERAGRVVETLFALMRTVGAYGAEHQAVADAVKPLVEALLVAEPPFAIAFVGEGVYRDKELIPLTPDRYQRALTLAKALRNLGNHEITFEGETDPNDLIRFGTALAQGQTGQSSALDFLKIPGIRWRDIPNAYQGSEAESVDDSVFTSVQVVLALTSTETIATQREGPWPWSEGFSVIRRLEQASQKSLPATLYALETAPGDWGHERSAVSAAFLVHATTAHVGAGRAVQRAAAHATLALTLQGSTANVGLAEAAMQLLPRMSAHPHSGRSGVEPHKLRVCALVHRLTERDSAGSASMAIGQLVNLAYELERHRRPAGARFTLALVDLLAKAVQWSDEVCSLEVRRALTAAIGLLPPGTEVGLADGRIAQVLGPSEAGDPWRPMVLVDGTLLIPSEPVSLRPVTLRRSSLQ